MLDERVTTQGTHHIEPGNAGFVGWREFRQGRGLLAGEAHTKTLDQLAWRNRAQSANHAVAFQHLFTCRCIEHHAQSGASCALACLAFGEIHHRDHHGAVKVFLRRRRLRLHLVDMVDGGAVAAGQLVVAYRRLDGAQVAFLAAAELVVAVEQDDPVVVRGQGQSVFDGRIASAHDDDGFATVSSRVVELVLDVGQVVALHAERAQVALHADGQHDLFGGDQLRAIQRDPELSLFACYAGNHRVVAHLHGQRTRLGGELFQNALAGASDKTQRAAQIEKARLGHHMFTLLVLVDGVGQVRLGFQQDVAQTQLGRMRCGGKSGGAGPDDGNGIGLVFHHGTSSACRQRRGHQGPESAQTRLEIGGLVGLIFQQCRAQIGQALVERSSRFELAHLVQRVHHAA